MRAMRCGGTEAIQIIERAYPNLAYVNELE
jgi:hypothetical protein